MLDLKNINIEKRKKFLKNINVKKGLFCLNIYSAKIFGPGIFNLSILKNNKKIFEFQFVSQSSSMFSKEIYIDSNDIYTFVLNTNYQGRVLINRATMIRVDSANNTSKKLRKKIACIIPYSIYGGAEIYLKNIIEQSQIYNISWDILYIQRNPLQNLLSTLNVQHIECINFNNFNNYILSNSYDFIFFYNSNTIYQKLCRTKAYNLSKLVQIYHSDLKWSDSINQNGNLPYVDSTIKISNLVGKNIKNYTLIKPIIDIKKFTPSSTKRTMIGTVARFSSEKNLTYILKIAKILKNYNFVIYGEGNLKNDFIFQMKKNNIQNITVESFKNDIYNYYNNFGLFLLTSKIEGLPLTVIEAMSCNVPVIAPKVGGLAELIDSKLINELTMNPVDDSNSIKNIFNSKVNSREYVILNHSFKSYQKVFEKMLEDISLSVREKNIIEKTLDFYYV